MNDDWCVSCMAEPATRTIGITCRVCDRCRDIVNRTGNFAVIVPKKDYFGASHGYEGRAYAHNTGTIWRSEGSSAREALIRLHEDVMNTDLEATSGRRREGDGK